ncbi:hypothetical protein HPG69_001988, partial [Diceros bicornis minor]
GARRAAAHNQKYTLGKQENWLHFFTFIYASAIGFFYCSVVSIGRTEDPQSNNLHNDPHTRHSDDNRHKHVERWTNFSADASQHKDENTDIVEKLLSENGPTLLETIKAFQFVHDRYLKDADWFMEAEYDTLVLLDSLTIILLQRVLVTTHLAVCFLGLTTVYKFDSLVYYLHPCGY